MIFEIIFWSLSIILSLLTTYYIWLSIGWYFFWIAFFLVPLYFLVLFAIYLFVFSIHGLFLNKKKDTKKPSKYYYFLLYETNYIICSLCNVRIKVTGLEKLPPKKTNVVLVHNHRSNFDEMIMIKKLPLQPLICITKPENFDFPIAGPIIHHAGFIQINRQDARKALIAIKRASAVINNHQGSICIAPEGTRNKTDATLLPMHAGSFKIAFMTKAPIVLCCLKGTNMVHKNAPFKKTKTEIHILKVLYYNDYKDMDTIEIRDLTYNLIKEDYEKNN